MGAHGGEPVQGVENLFTDSRADIAKLEHEAGHRALEMVGCEQNTQYWRK